MAFWAEQRAELDGVNYGLFGVAETQRQVAGGRPTRPMHRTGELIAHSLSSHAETNQTGDASDPRGPR